MTDPDLPDLLATLSDLASALGQRHEESRRQLTRAAEEINSKMNEIDRLLLAGARIMQQIDARMRARPQSFEARPYRDREPTE